MDNAQIESKAKIVDVTQLVGKIDDERIKGRIGIVKVLSYRLSGEKRETQSLRLRQGNNGCTHFEPETGQSVRESCEYAAKWNVAFGFVLKSVRKTRFVGIIMHTKTTQ